MSDDKDLESQQAEIDAEINDDFGFAAAFGFCSFGFLRLRVFAASGFLCFWLRSLLLRFCGFRSFWVLRFLFSLGFVVSVSLSWLLGLTHC